LTIGMAIRQFMFGLGPWAVTPLFIGAVVGTALGVVQMFNVKQYVPRPGWWWVLSNTIGWSAAWVIINLQVGYSLLGLGITEFSIVRGTVAGILVGLLQWLILRQLFYRAGWWILVSPLGWGIGMAVGVTVGGAFGWPLVGAISGIIAGYPLIWILRQPRR
jgi:hypothetical protein